MIAKFEGMNLLEQAAYLSAIYGQILDEGVNAKHQKDRLCEAWNISFTQLQDFDQKYSCKISDESIRGEYRSQLLELHNAMGERWKRANEARRDAAPIDQIFQEFGFDLANLPGQMCEAFGVVVVDPIIIRRVFGEQGARSLNGRLKHSYIVKRFAEIGHCGKSVLLAEEAQSKLEAQKAATSINASTEAGINAVNGSHNHLKREPESEDEQKISKKARS